MKYIPNKIADCILLLEVVYTTYFLLSPENNLGLSKFSKTDVLVEIKNKISWWSPIIEKLQDLSQ